MAESKSTSLGCGAIIGIFVLVYILSKACNSDSSTESNHHNHDNMAYVTSQDFVKTKLNFPEEAEFPWSAISIKEISPDNSLGVSRYDVTGYVITKNAFGVKQKYKYECLLNFTEGGDEMKTSDWDLVSVNLEKP